MSLGKNKFIKAIKLVSWPDILFVMLAVTLQILITLPILSNTGIKVASSDLLLLPIMTVLLLNYIKQGSGFILWDIPHIWKWLFLLTLWMSISLINGFIYIGEIQNWALINKYFGWYVLLAYFIFGAFVANNASDESIALFFKTLFVCACGIGIVSIPLYFLNLFHRFEGLTGNPNSYGFLLVIITIILLTYKMRGNIISKSFDTFGIGFLLTLIVYSGSKSAWLGLFFGIIFLSLARKNLYRQLAPIALVALLLVIILYFLKASGIFTEDTHVYPVSQNLLNPNHYNHRLEIMNHAHELWKTHPVFGVGLGSFLQYSVNELGGYTIHSTPYWLLVETGIIGLVLFASFFLYVILHLWKQNTTAGNGWAICGGIAILISFAAASIGFEAMYQRHIWFFSGWAIAYGTARKMRKQ